MWADFHAVTVCSCQCMSNSSPCGSALLAVMNSSQGRQVKLQYLLNFKTRHSINEEHHWFISIEWCLIPPLFSCPLPVVNCKSSLEIKSSFFHVALWSQQTLHISGNDFLLAVPVLVATKRRKVQSTEREAYQDWLLIQ